MSDDSGGLLISGGVGGIAVNLAELEAAAGVLDAAGEAIGDAAAWLRASAARLAVGAALAPGSAVPARASLEAAADVLGGLESDLADTAAGARAAGEAYAAAEHASQAGVGSLDRVVAIAARAVGLVLPVPGAPFLASPERAVRPAGWLVGVLPSARASAVVVQEGEHDRGEPARGAAGLLSGIERLYPQGGGREGSIAVQRIDRPDGATSWAVLIPGTQSLAVGGRNPMDDATNIQEYTGAPSAMGVAVVAALAAAGARPTEPVLLAGHSQGGMVAMRLAANPAFRRDYRVTAVLTAGSPVGHVPSPRGVSVLHLEHARDVVPTLDVAPNPSDADRVTVVAAGESGLGESHSMPAYVRTAERVDASTDPSVVEWRTRADEVLGGAGATATTTVYVATRPP